MPVGPPDDLDSPLDAPPTSGWAEVWAEGPGPAGWVVATPTRDGSVPLVHGVPLSALFARMQEAIIVVDLAFEVLVWSPGAERIFGWTAAETVGHSAWQFLAPTLDAAGIAAFRQKALLEGEFQQVVARRTKDGRSIRTELSVSLVSDAAGQPAALLAVSRDVTEREAEAMAREAALVRTREHERFLEALFAHMDDAVVATGSDLRVQTWSPGAERLYGHVTDDAVGRPFHEVVCPGEPLERVQRLVDDVRVAGRARFTTACPGPDGRRLVIEVTLALLRDGADEPVGLLLVAHDVTEREAWADAQRVLQAELTAANAELLITQRELLALATTDQLTGVATRRAILDVAAAEWRRARDQKRPFTCIMADVDRFKQVNDGLGHLAGDAVLRHVAVIVKRSIRGTDAVGRYGGEEFLIICPDASPEKAVEIAERVRQAVEETPCRAHGTSLQVTLSLGVAASREPREALERVLHDADAALYAAKRAGRNRVVAADGEG